MRLVCISLLLPLLLLLMVMMVMFMMIVKLFSSQQATVTALIGRHDTRAVLVAMVTATHLQCYLTYVFLFSSPS